jgi:branched-chain amino acid transport system ATP-binding protein
VEEGEISSIIGPNGAGKTTLFNLIVGRYRPDSGRIIYNGEQVQRKPIQYIANLGIARAFQRCNIFPKLTVFENVRVAVISRQRESLTLFRNVASLGEVREEVRRILEMIGMADKAHQISGELAHGDQKLLDIGIALALKSKLLLLDEPMAGMSPEERKRMVNMIYKLWEGLAVTLVFIEHDMDMVFSISQKIRVLSYGLLLAEGTPQEISRNEQVIAAYLGKKSDSLPVATTEGA